MSEYKGILREKQGGSKIRAKKRWLDANEKASNLINVLSDRDKVILLCGIYWGEGSKRELSLINGDPYLIKSFIDALDVLGIQKSDLKINLRVFVGMDKNSIINFWSKFLDLKADKFGKIEFVDGSKNGKLPHGMCRVRVAKSGSSFKLIMSMIDFMSGKICRHSSMDRTRDS